ncbi:Bifunctional cytochrome P450/NADPH--P450 reductase OS=Streptomyces alboniger OX=132473 GN=CP975_32150 PE=3 SV=1 [Streptomyces alboniger]
MARADTVIGGRHPVAAGQSLVVLTPVLHRDPVWGDNVEEFDPERFTPEAEAARSPHAYKPFGTGERACVGRQFALHEATMLLGMLVHRYRFIDHARYRLEVKETLTLKPDAFTMTLAARTPRDRAHTREALRELTALAAPAGRGDAAGGTEAGLPTRAVAGTALTLLHGSNFGTCRAYAEQLGEQAADLGFAVRVAPLDEAAGALPTDGPLVIVTASYNGRPTDDAREFMSWLTEAGADDAAGVRYAVLGVGDRNWAATYQRVPTLVDERLAAAGATRLLERAEAHASGDLAGSVRRFADALRTELLRRYGDPSVGAPDTAPPPHGHDVTEVTGGPLTALAARHGTVPMTVVEARDLVDLTHPLARPKRFLRLALPEGTAYRTADHLSVLPVNDPDLVRRATEVLGVDPDTVLNIRAHRPGRSTLPVDRPVTVRTLLSHYVELRDAPHHRAGRGPGRARPVPAGEGGAGTAGGRRRRGVRPAGQPARPDRGPPGAAGTAALARAPRSAAARQDPPLLHLLVTGGFTGPRGSDGLAPERPRPLGPGTYRGTGSSYLHRVEAGDTVHARVRPCRDAFRVPADTGTPVIMVSAGTGLAPFRGAIADRLALLRAGTRPAPALCYFGRDYSLDVDYLHRAELEDAERAGGVAASHVLQGPAGELLFVQHRIEAEAEEVRRLLDAGARVYVCGDGSRLAPGVREAFQRLYAKSAGCDSATAEAWLRDLVAEGRYVEDVYASS